MGFHWPVRVMSGLVNNCGCFPTLIYNGPVIINKSLNNRMHSSNVSRKEKKVRFLSIRVTLVLSVVKSVVSSFKQK